MGAAAFENALVFAALGFPQDDVVIAGAGDDFAVGTEGDFVQGALVPAAAFADDGNHFQARNVLTGVNLVTVQVVQRGERGRLFDDRGWIAHDVFRWTAAGK